MTLYDILNQVEYGATIGANTEITALTIDSRAVTDGTLFICIRGLRSDGHDYINAAAEKGAAAIVCETMPAEIPTGVTMIQVADARQALAHIAANFYGNPSESLTMLGITGTNGKTSTTYFVEAIWHATGVRAGVIGTSGARIHDEVLDIPFASSSTPDAIELHQILRAMKDFGAAAVVMEATSHGLTQQRTEGIAYKIGMFTNLTQDHLDFHGTMEQYKTEKAKLFAACEIGVFNADDKYALDIMQNAPCRGVTYGIDAACDYRAKNVVLTHEGVRYDVDIAGEITHIESPIPGRFTVYNTLCAIAAAAELGIPSAAIRAGLQNLANVPGRIQSVPNDKGFGVIIDYSHTPDGVDNILSAVRGFTTNQLIAVLGCGGDRDRTKRPIMGESAGRGADYVVLTSDNPRSEQPVDIIADMLPGIQKTDCPYETEPDRRKAIFAAVQRAKPGDNIVLAGKGSEDYQEFENKRREPFDDVTVAKEALAALDAEGKQ